MQGDQVNKFDYIGMEPEHVRKEREDDEELELAVTELANLMRESNATSKAFARFICNEFDVSTVDELCRFIRKVTK
jgi:hypothetical protein